MQEYEIKKGHFKNIDGSKLKELLSDIFGNVKMNENKLQTSYGALSQLTVWLKDKNTVCVETVMNRDVNDKLATDTIKSYNLFLEKATGFTSKERRERLQKKAKEGKL